MSIPRKRKTRQAAGAMLLVLLAVAALVHLGRQSPKPDNAAAESAGLDEQTQPARRPPLPVVIAAPAEAPAAIQVKQAPLIAAIDVEPAAPCRDQEVLVTVHVLPDARDSKVFVAGMPGSPAVLRFLHAGATQVEVVARDWYDRIEHRLASVDVRDCQDEGGLALGVRRFGSGRILARASGRAAAATTFEWDFGDGVRASTQAPFAEHDYALRDQRTATSTFLVAVRATSPGGQATTARAAITFVNADFIAILSGTPTLPARYNRFARRQDGAAETELELRNILPAPVRWETVETTTFSCDGTAEPVSRTGDASLALSADAIASGAVAKLRLSLPVDWLGPDACRAQVWLHGRAGPAEVRVPVVLELGVPAARLPITNPERLALLAQTARSLGGTRFTDEDLARVQASGAP